MVGRMLRTADFERVLACRPRARSAHFAVHHLLASPSVPARPGQPPATAELSTADAPSCPPLVDSLLLAAALEPVSGRWLGMVVPKRHARRSVTRSLVKRQMRAVMAARAASLPPGLWVLRLKSVFDLKQFRSAASDALRLRVRDELQQLLQQAAARGHGHG